MKKTTLVLTLALIVLFLACKTQTKEPEVAKFQLATPEEVGMNSDSLAKIETLVKTYVDAKKYPGAVTLIAKNGKINTRNKSH